ncbi:Uncharacterised protein [Edwardsiella hoshinae]|uniref:Uncharacterized protein n=1 Tax=Edwardsiella hoshinae TaxID=93378 RepID=A0A376DD33_9GAMM|nr:Uncharacterised protein [Edwardsiella hoshinae]
MELLSRMIILIFNGSLTLVALGWIFRVIAISPLPYSVFFLCVGISSHREGQARINQ